MHLRWDHWVVILWFALTGVVIGFELWTVVNHSGRTPPLTDVTVRYLPWWIAIPFITWLLVHFSLHYAANTTWTSKFFAWVSAK